MQAPTTFAPRPSSSWSSSCSPSDDDDDEPAFDRVAAGIAAQGTPAPALWDADTEAPRVHENNDDGGDDAGDSDDAPGRDEVVKLARVEKRGPVRYYKVYWASGRPTEEPLTHLDGVDPEWIAKADALARGNKAVLLTGARKDRSSRVGSSRKGLTSRVTAFLIQAPQYCVLNSLRNLLGDDDALLPETCVAAIAALGPSISVKDLVGATTLGRSVALRLPFMLERAKGVHRTGIIDYLVGQTAGKYLLLTEHGRHCVAVDADRGLIMETDPAFPRPQPLSRTGFDALGVRGVHSCRRVVPKQRRKPSRKRKRAAATP